MMMTFLSWILDFSCPIAPRHARPLWLRGCQSMALIAITCSPSWWLHRVEAQPVASSYQAQLTNLSYQRIERGIGTRVAIGVEVHPGRITTIDFSPTEETIRYIGLGDASRVVFNTDTPIETNSAQTIFLRTIKPLKFEGATTAAVTNLVVKTTDGEGKERLYNFQIIHRQTTPTHLGVQIVPGVGIEAVIEIGGGRRATLEDVEMGLLLAINRSYTSTDDPVVLAVRKFMAIVRHQETTIAEAARLADVELAVIVELAKIAVERKLVSPDAQPPSALINN